MLKVYIAGASKEITRAERWAGRLTEAGVIVTSSWMANIRQVGKNNPTDASIEQYREWSLRCLKDTRDADVFWLLLPETDTVGAYVELGFAQACGKLIVASGTHRPIFTPGLATHHSHYDAEVADYLIRLSKQTNGAIEVPFKVEGVTGRDWSL